MLNRYYPAIDDPHSAWKNHINTQVSFDEISSSIKKQYTQSVKQAEVLSDAINQAKIEYIDAVSNMSEDISSAIDFCASRICDSLDQGFDLLSNDINELGRSLDFRLSLILEQEILNNLISENIALLLRIPDIQKERQYYLEQGLKHLKNSFIDKEFYKYALENLLEAEKREKTDYVTLHHIGMIYLYSADYLDLSEAENYFRRAAKFAKIESDPKAIRLANIISGNVLSKLADNVPDIQKMRYVSAESYLQGAIACYIQKKYSESSELAQIAFDLVPDMLEAGFYGCLSNALEGKEDKTIKLLSILVEKNPNYAVIAAIDPVLAPKNYIQVWLLKLKQNTISKAQSLIEGIKSIILRNSKFYSDLNEAELYLSKASYIDALNIISFLNFELPVKEEIQVCNINVQNIALLKNIINENANIVSHLHLDLSVSGLKEINCDSNIIEIENLLESNNSCDQWILSNRIFSLGKQIKKTIYENLEKVDQSCSYLRKDKTNVRIELNQKADNIIKSNRTIKVIGFAISFVIGFKGCYTTADSPGYGGSIMAPFGSFFLYSIIGVIITYAIIWFMMNKEVRYRNISKLEINFNMREEQLNKNIDRFKGLINSLSAIEENHLISRYSPFNKYIEILHQTKYLY